MLVIKCAACKRKLWKYNKLGKGKVLKCYKERIQKYYYEAVKDHKVIKCACGKEIGIDKGSYIKMNQDTFTYTGTKSNK
jgi:hypothetical protein